MTVTSNSLHGTICRAAIVRTVCVFACLVWCCSVHGQEIATDATAAEALSGTSAHAQDDQPWAEWLAKMDVTRPEATMVGLRTVLMISVFSLAPAILLMTTSFVRIAVVLGLLRQALGTQLLPSNQVITSLALFMTGIIMWPSWQQVYENAVVPYTDPEVSMSVEQAWLAGVQPIRHFMSQQIDIAGNGEDIWLFYEYLATSENPPQTYEEVPLAALLPAFMLSELKTAFLIGFQIYLPFLILDLVVSSVTVSMGMLALPPTMISLPFKLLMFVLVDGWHLVVGMLMESFAAAG